jgi:hypothetical protein
MDCKRTIATLKFASLGVLFATLLFGDSSWSRSSIRVGPIVRDFTDVFHDPETQWMVFSCLCIYSATFLSFRFRRVIPRRSSRKTISTNEDGEDVSISRQGGNHILWFAAGVVMSALVYAFNYTASIQALILLGSVVIGLGVSTGANFESRRGGGNLPVMVICVLIILLTGASLWNEALGRSEYHGQVRWLGPWDNPNLFGTLMGTGVVLALGFRNAHLGFANIGPGGKTWKTNVGGSRVVIFSICAAIFTGRGLLHSLSRGAWLGTLCGLAYLAGAMLQNRNFWLRRVWVSRLGGSLVTVLVIMASVMLLCFWQFKQTDWHPAQRAFSAVNLADFSWRNRVLGWEGALQITAERPWYGVGWHQPQLIYEHYYLPPTVISGGAIEMNDYLILCASLGVLALFCFGMYIWLSLTRSAECRVQFFSKSETGRQHEESGTEQIGWLKVICRAGAIVLLVGFWFDGGLFKLPTASTFWILLELGAV